MNRNQAIDFFRGLFLIIMMVDHLLIFGFGALFFIYNYSFQMFGFVSAAEGFVFISGLMCGMVYGKVALRSLDEFKSKLLSRLKLIYIYHFRAISLIAIMFAIPQLNSLWQLTWDGKLALWKQAPIKAWFHGITLLYQTSFVDVLPLYLMLMFGLLISMPYLLKAKPWQFLAVSISLWFAGQFYPQEAFGQSIGHLLGWFEVLSWQLLFFGAAYLGLQHIRGHKIPINNHAFGIALITSLVLFYIRHFHLSQAEAIGLNLFNVRTLGLGRILNFISLGYVIYFLSARGLVRFSLAAINILGRNSLKVFSVHLVIVYFTGFLKPWISAQGLMIQLGLFGISILSLYLPVIYSELLVALKRPSKMALKT